MNNKIFFKGSKGQPKRRKKIFRKKYDSESDYLDKCVSLESVEGNQFLMQ